jgi:hypothetical protein
MYKAKPKLHNSKANKHLLPPLQKKIVLYLSKNDPKTINEAVKDLKSHYKSTWTSFRSLEKKKIIKAVETKTYQGKEFPRYWLGEDGTYAAILEGAKVDTVVKKAKEIFPDEKELHYFLDITSIFGIDAFEIGFRALFAKGKVEPEDIAAMLVNQMLKGISPAALGKFYVLLRQYPKHNLEMEKLMKDLGSNMNKFQEEFSNKA